VFHHHNEIELPIAQTYLKTLNVQKLDLNHEITLGSKRRKIRKIFKVNEN
jgi:hypothetical protein